MFEPHYTPFDHRWARRAHIALDSPMPSIESHNMDALLNSVSDEEWGYRAPNSSPDSIESPEVMDDLVNAINDHLVLDERVEELEAALERELCDANKYRERAILAWCIAIAVIALALRS